MREGKKVSVVMIDDIFDLRAYDVFAVSEKMSPAIVAGNQWQDL